MTGDLNEQSQSSENIRLRSLIVNPVGIGKKSFPIDKFSGQASLSNTSITSLQPVRWIQKAGMIHKLVCFLQTLGFDCDLYPKASTYSQAFPFLPVTWLTN